MPGLSHTYTEFLKRYMVSRSPRILNPFEDEANRACCASHKESSNWLLKVG
jgi:hypothetical protein